MYGVHSKYKTDMTNSCKHLVGQSERKKEPEKSECKWADIKTGLKKIWRGSGLHLSGSECSSVLSPCEYVFDLWYIKTEDFLDNWATTGFLSRTMNHGVSILGVTLPKDGAKAQPISRRLPTTATRVRAQVRSCGICGGRSGTGGYFIRVLLFPLTILIPSIASYSSYIIRGWYNRPVSGRRTKWTQFHPAPSYPAICAWVSEPASSLQGLRP
jgi:hypothetical protein